MNLWDDDTFTPLNTELPADILREQAGLLGGKVKNIITARVEESVSNGTELVYRFVIDGSPIVGNYRYKLFSIRYETALYPVSFVINNELQMTSPVDANSKDEFVEILRNIFNAPKTKQIIQVLLAHSKAKNRAYFPKHKDE